METKDWLDVLNANDHDTAYNSLIHELNDCICKTIPEKTVTCRNQEKNPWLTKGILNSIKHKNKLYKRLIKTQSDNNKNKYDIFRNKLTHIIRKSKCNYYTGRLNAVQGDSKRTWAVLNKVLNRGQRSLVLPDTANRNLPLLTDSFNNYFASIGQELANRIRHPQGNSYRNYLSGHYVHSVFMKPTDTTELKKIIKNMKNTHTAGADGICSKILIAVTDLIVLPLAHCINFSLLHGVVPKVTKIARIIPIYKSGDKNNISNYRPISVLPTLSKVLERVVYNSE